MYVCVYVYRGFIQQMFTLDRKLQRTITSARDKERLTSWDSSYLVSAMGEGEPDADADGGLVLFL